MTGRVGDVSPEMLATSAGSRIATQVFDVAIPGLGVVASLIVGKILRDSAKKEASKHAHFKDNVLSPMVAAMQAGRYRDALALVTRSAPGDAGEEHAGYLLQMYPQSGKLMYQAAAAAALTGNLELAQRFAAMLDYFKVQGAIDAAQTAAVLQYEAESQRAEQTHFYTTDDAGDNVRVAHDPERSD